MGQIGVASLSRVCYQRGLPRQVYIAFDDFSLQCIIAAKNVALIIKQVLPVFTHQGRGGHCYTPFPLLCDPCCLLLTMSASSLIISPLVTSFLLGCCFQYQILSQVPYWTQIWRCSHPRRDRFQRRNFYLDPGSFNLVTHPHH